MIYNDFPTDAAPCWVAADTETVTKIDGRVVDTLAIYEAVNSNPREWVYKHISVDAYAWLISDGEHLAIAENAGEFIEWLTVHKVYAVWWYNATFDFSFLDYYFLQNGWTLSKSGRLADKSYRSLHSEFGARYSLAHALNRRSASRHNYAHTVTHYDLRNLFKGGLAEVLKCLDVRDFSGNPIRKKSMEYQSTDFSPERIEYMRADAAGLYHAVRTADEYLYRRYGLHIAGKKPDVLTASGLSKRVFLERWYRCGDGRRNNLAYIAHHQITLSLDGWARAGWLLRGGIAFVNPEHCGKEVKDRIMHRYDFNQHYPARMSEMPDIYGVPVKMSKKQWESKGRPGPAILELDGVHGRVRPGMVGLWYDPVHRKYTDFADFDAEEAGHTLYMYAEEVEEFCKYWYDMEISVNAVWVCRSRKVPHYREYVAENMADKVAGKKEGNDVKVAFAKLLNNGLGGKLSENPCRVTTHREISDNGAVHLVEDGEEVSDTSRMNIFQGAYMMAMARVVLMRSIRAICSCSSVEDSFVYCDTDSIHAFAEYDGCDPYALGALKDEGAFDRVKYIAPKTYIDYRGGESPKMEIHAKGVNIDAIMASYLTEDKEEFFRLQELERGTIPERFADAIKTVPGLVDRIFDEFAAGKKFTSLAGLNVPGGKALLPLDKYILRPERGITEDGEEIEQNVTDKPE